MSCIILKNYTKIFFEGYFHRLGIFNAKPMLDIQNCMKVIMTKLLWYFSVRYMTKFEIKTQLFSKKQNGEI
jgi:hypothetical protein